jgi:hypothetical protein
MDILGLSQDFLGGRRITHPDWTDIAVTTHTLFGGVPCHRLQPIGVTRPKKFWSVGVNTGNSILRYEDEHVELQQLKVLPLGLVRDGSRSIR